MRIEIGRLARRTLGVLLITAMVTAPTVVLANHDFPDVPTTSPFHDAITAIAEAGITTGFDDGTYRPSDPITRQAMAAFMHRGFGHVEWLQGSDSDSLEVGAAQQTGLEVAIQGVGLIVFAAPNEYGPEQYVYVQGQLTLDAAMDATKGCPCEFTVYLIDDRTNAVVSQVQTFESVSNLAFGHSIHVDALFPALPGVNSYFMTAKVTSRANATNAATFSIDDRSTLSAMTFPFRALGPG